jgi:II/X family phage/plasmid replication protein
VTPMIDTMGFIIPLSFQLYDHLKDTSICTQRIDKSTGEIEFEYDNFDVVIPSSNYSVKFKLDDRRFIYDSDLKISVTEPGFPHLRLEFSAPKVLFRHNLISIDIATALEAGFIVQKAFEDQFDCKLPHIGDWFLKRLDVCANYIIENEAQVKNYMRHVQRMEYPRRIKNLYEDSGIYFASRHNTLKMYAKGDEFKKHDLKRFPDEVEAQRLYDQAKPLLRIEAELKGRIKYLHAKYMEDTTPAERMEYITWSGYPHVIDFLEYANMENELSRMIQTFLLGKETKSMECAKVHEILRAHYSTKQADSFHHVYMVIVTQGLREAKRQFTKEKLMRAKRAFRENGISFVSDVIKIDNVETLFPADFSLEISEKNKYYQMPIAV